MTDWRGKVVVITGGSAGLGRALATVFGRAGCQLVLAARDAQRLQQTCADLTAEGIRANGLPTDVTNDVEVTALIDGTIQQHGRLDVLINNAGRSMRGRLLDTAADEFQALIELNFLATVRCTKAAAPHLIASRGHIVNIGSLASKVAARHLGAYPASKAPLVTYSQQLRLELGAQGVHVLLVCPGPLAREDAGQRYDLESEGLPDSARRPGGGVKLSGIPPRRLADLILRACNRGTAELVVPWKAKLLFALAQLSPRWGDWVVQRMT